MNKMEFFKILEEGLIDFPAHELQEILYDYKEHFSNAQSDGKTEEEIIEELGDPYTIVNQYRSNYIQVSTTNTEYEILMKKKKLTTKHILITMMIPIKNTLIIALIAHLIL